MLRASTFEVRRRAAALGLAASSELDDIANQAADDALLAVMSRLDRFERRSRFTTWAYKFAIHTAGVAVRRHAWRDRNLAPSSSESLEQLSRLSDDPGEAAQTRELLARIAAAITRLTAHQRDVLLALAVDGVPIDVLADRLSTNRNALYKTLHDARTRLRGLLDEEETNDDNTYAHRSWPRCSGPAGPEIGCDECFERLDGYVELEIAGADAEAATPGMRAHLAGCPACSEEHDSLLRASS